ncbi:MAG: hypothetical protein H6970_00115 [Gammaproteobacteria bacterium]|nr:hypothetical protein [Gammaproteobacteria bacterium]MCP5423463.1 hypothetical protein [Gammaproteobacteria bacterium]MCP5458780.1 hypothetical protein [Gammaproteobacteria bacterium]
MSILPLPDVPAEPEQGPKAMDGPNYCGNGLYQSVANPLQSAAQDEPLALANTRDGDELSNFQAWLLEQHLRARTSYPLSLTTPVSTSIDPRWQAARGHAGASWR